MLMLLLGGCTRIDRRQKFRDFSAIQQDLIKLLGCCLLCKIFTASGFCAHRLLNNREKIKEDGSKSLSKAGTVPRKKVCSKLKIHLAFLCYQQENLCRSFVLSVSQKQILLCFELFARS